MSYRYVHAAGDCYYNYCAAYRSRYYGQPLVGDNAEAVHKAYTGRDKEKSEIMYKKVGQSVDMPWFDQAGAQRRRQKKHADYA